jgi:hypothetical protein
MIGQETTQPPSDIDRAMQEIEKWYADLKAKQNRKPTPAELDATAKKYGVTVQQILQKFGQDTWPVWMVLGLGFVLMFSLDVFKSVRGSRPPYRGGGKKHRRRYVRRR